MQTQNVFIAHPTTTEQINALKAFAKALNIKFEIRTTEKAYDQAFVDKILQGDEDFKAGKGKRMTMEELNGLSNNLPAEILLIFRINGNGLTG